MSAAGFSRKTAGRDVGFQQCLDAAAQRRVVAASMRNNSARRSAGISRASRKMSFCRFAVSGIT